MYEEKRESNDPKTVFSPSSPFLSAQLLSFQSEPTSLVQSRGSVARLRCLASPPSAVVSWRFGGLPLDKDTLPGLEITEDSLTISSLKLSHVGVYQCVARLDRGPAIASRQARVTIAGTDAENDPFVCNFTPLTATILRQRGSCLESRKAK